MTRPQDAPPPLVSVVIPARNAAATVERAVRSVLLQDYPVLEVLVIDDASTDETVAIVERIADVRVSVIRLLSHSGVAAARNAGIRAANGPLIAFQDADDEWLPSKLSRQTALLHANPGLGFVACDCRFIGPEGEECGLLYDGQRPPPGTEAWRRLLALNTIATPSVVVQRAALLEAGGFDETLQIAEDQDLWIRLSMRTGLAYLPEPLVLVHAVHGSLSSVGSRHSYRQQLVCTMPMIERHLAAKAGDLRRQEIRRIRGERVGRIGRSAFTHGAYGDGARLIARASLLGFEPLRNVVFLLSAMPASRWLKQRLRRAS